MGLRERIGELMPRARAELSDLVAIKSVADPRQYPPEECQAAAQWCWTSSSKSASLTRGSP